MTKPNHVLKLLIVMVSVFIIGYILEPFRNISPLLGDYFEVSTELLPLVMSFSIFVTTWFAYDKSRDDNSFFLGASFFVMGLLELFQMLSHPYMPDFITPNSIQKAVNFRVMLWIISVLLFFVSAYIYKDSIPGIISKYVIFAFAIILSLMSLTMILFYPDRLPEVYSLKGSLSTTWFSLVLITSIMLFYSSYLYLKRLRKTGEKNIICLIYGFVLTSVSILVYFDYTYSGYLLQAAGFYFVYLAMIKSSIERPYENLAIAEHKMRYVAEEKYRNLFDNANDAIVITDLDDRIISWNRSAENIFGWSAEEVAEKKFSELVVPPQLHTEMKHITNNVISGSMTRGFDFVNLHKDGNEIDVSMTISPLLNSEHNIIGLSSIVRDITERKRDEEQIRSSLHEKEVLLREIHHRVKNNMQVLSSLLRLQSDFCKDKNVIEMFNESRNRIISMSLIHEKLYLSKDFTKIDLKGYINEMVNGLFQSYCLNKSKIALNIYVEDVPLGIESAIPCGLIINELVTNSLKYAFPGDRNGEIKIILRLAEENMIELVVSDNGIGIPKSLNMQKIESLGLHLVTMLAENQLMGKMNMNVNNGTEFQIKFRGVK